MKVSMQNYTLIVTEKPDVAKRIAYALDRNGKPKHLKKNGVPYFVVQRDRLLLIIPAIGHLYTIVQEKGKRSIYPVFNFKWVPRHLGERKAKGIRKWIETFSELSQGADEFISACDYDLEGSLIGYCILKYACGGKEDIAKRMKFSTLMKDELEKAYEEPIKHLNFAWIESGRTRHEVDWLYGINLSRALTAAAKYWSGRYFTLSTGRVQGPTLQFLAAREKAIRSFVPIPYWQLSADVEIQNSIVNAEYEKPHVETRAEAEAVLQACNGKTGEIKNFDVKTIYQKSPIPFDVGTLQREAYKIFGYTPRRTLLIAQNLYLDVLISYPRTDSQKLPSNIGYRKILKALSRKFEYKQLASKLLEKDCLKPREGIKEDPAHPSIYPTGNLPEKPLGIPEKRIWDLIVRRFMAAFGEDAQKENINAILDVNRYAFFLKGRRILKEGWMLFYKPYIRTQEIFLPPLKIGDFVWMRRVTLQDKFTCPPPHYNHSSLLKKMEQLGIGTKATRGEIIQTLFNRGYVMDQSIVVTELGFNIIDVLENYSSNVVSALLTKELEEKMEQIQNGTMKRETVLAEVIEQLKLQIAHFKENEESIGEALTIAIKKSKTEELLIGKCPKCGTGKLVIITSRKTKKRFIGCTNYFNKLCEISFPLPQYGTVKPAKNKCKACSWPTVLVWLKSKKPWNLCFNPSCLLKEGKRIKQ
jgi:DNA topoisomerase-1